jgi:SnoaL-like domain
MPIDDDIAVRELTDRATITEVPHTYARLVDERDFAAVARVFTDDCLALHGRQRHSFVSRRPPISSCTERSNSTAGVWGRPAPIGMACSRK